MFIYQYLKLMLGFQFYKLSMTPLASYIVILAPTTFYMCLMNQATLNVVFEGPVRSGFFPFLGQTGTATGSYIFSRYEKPCRTAHNRLCAVRPGLKVGFDRLGHNRS